MLMILFLRASLFPKTYTLQQCNCRYGHPCHVDQFETETADLNLDAARITLNKRYNFLPY